MPKEQTYGPNEWLVEEMYERYRANPDSVSANWRDFFADNFRPTAATVTDNEISNGLSPRQVHQGAPSTTDAPIGQGADNQPTRLPIAGESRELKGVGVRIVQNMEASLAVPTATSVRQIPAKLLEVNRDTINQHLRRTRMGKISFTHVIAFAVVEALRSVPSMANYFMEIDGKPNVVSPEHVGLGLAVDLPKPDGTRSLVVPCIKQAETLNFREFWSAYDELIRKVRTNKVSVDDYSGVTATLTNPGTIGTVHSVPRLMPGQGLIVGVGAIDYSAEFQSADRRVLASLGVSKMITISSTYDHRIIQGAESGLFLQKVHQLLTGEDAFYDRIFDALAIPYEPTRWSTDVNPMNDEDARTEKQHRVWHLINMYRVRGHLIADLDPLHTKPPSTHPELDPASYGLSIWDLDREFHVEGLACKRKMTLNEALNVLRDSYCRSIGVEYMHIQNPDEKRWIQETVEAQPLSIEDEHQRYVLSRLNAAEALERFLATKYVGQKRFGLEGAESAIPLLDTILDEAAKADIPEAVMGMAHRGRLNVLINIVGKGYGDLFKEFEGNIDPNAPQGSGDVKYHKGFRSKYCGRSGKSINLSLASNPSHLEAVDPVVEGMARATEDLLDRRGLRFTNEAPFPAIPILVHGDAAFAGQGVVAETLNMSAVRGYRTGGTIHLVINNQVGFTTAPDSGRSSVYPTDVAKMVQAPIFHVNGDDPEACVRVAQLAFAYREKFHKDVVIDMVCYRRYGHNEGDEPSYTQPAMYKKIQDRRSVRKLYTEALISRGDFTLEEAEDALEEFSQRLQQALDETRSSAPKEVSELPPPRPLRDIEAPIETGFDRDQLNEIVTALSSVPDGFNVHPKLQKLLDARAKLFESGQIDWALGEGMAYGSVLFEGIDVRLSGQDTRRGTFSHRHGVLVDYETGDEYVPLEELARTHDKGETLCAGHLYLFDSILSEYSTLGFEYGYSVRHPNALVLWEAQFGDFVNGAQIVVDQFIAAAGEKWGQKSTLTLLLPHGYEGQGPEHSSARLERFLELCANDNMRVASPTTSSQFFHLLRRQAKSSSKLPLIVMAPKYLLRSSHSRSSFEEFVQGSFREVLDDAKYANDVHEEVERIVFATGKVAYDAIEERDKRNSSTAIVRLEQLYPWPNGAIQRVFEKYPNASDLVWLQEEPVNMGAWTFVFPRLWALLGGNSGRSLTQPKSSIRFVAREASGSPATGIHALHELEHADLMRRIFEVA